MSSNSMLYDERSVTEINEKYQDIRRIQNEIVSRLGILNSKLRNDTGKEYLMQGAVIVASFVYHAAKRDEKLPRIPRLQE